MKKKVVAGCWLLAIAIFSASAYALGVASDFLENNTLHIEAGSYKEFRITLQNSEDELQAVHVSVTSDNDIAGLVDARDSYELPPKSYNTQLVINITIPKDAKAGASYDAGYSVGQGKAKEGGPVPFVVNVNRGFKVVVKEPKVAVVEAVPQEQPEKKVKTSPITGKLSYQKISGAASQVILFTFLGIVISAILMLAWNRSLRLSKAVVKSNSVSPELIKFYQQLLPLDEAAFQEHIHAYREHIHAWVSQTLNNQKLANQLYYARSKQEFIQLLKNEVE